MTNIAKTTLLTGSLLVSTFLAGQGNGNGNGAQLEINCRPTIIVGEKNPTPERTYTYTHDYEHQNGEQFKWEVEGALVLDGQPTDANHKGTVTKEGNSVDVVWDKENPTGRLKVAPVSDCAGLAQGGGLGGGVVVEKAAGSPYIPTPYEFVVTPCSNGSINELQIAMIFFLCGGLEYIEIIGTSNATLMNNGEQFPNSESSTGWVYGIIPNGEAQVTIKEHYFDCNGNYTGFTTHVIYIPYVDEPSDLYDIEITGNVCGNSTVTFTALTGGSTLGDSYNWNINFGNGNTVTETTQTNSWTGNVPSGSPYASVAVSAVNRCGSKSYFKNFAPSNPIVALPVIDMPDCYQGGTGNTFEVANPQNGLEYCWRLTNVFDRNAVDISGQYSQECGLDKTTFNPDFGTYGNIIFEDGGRVGKIKDFTVTLFARKCDGSTATATSITVNDVVYSSCNAPHQITTGGNPNDKEFSIDLLPNPAQNRVTIKFPAGNDTKNVRIVDAYGVERKNVTTTNTSETISIADLPLGTYTVIAVKNSEIATEHLQVTP